MSTSKNRPLVGMDLPPRVTGGGGSAITIVPNVAPPAQPVIAAPYDLTVIGNDLLRSAFTAEARLTVRWRPPVGVVPTSYDLQWATNSSFTAGLGGKTAHTSDAQIPGLATNTLYYVRVRAVVGALQSGWSNVVSATTSQDTTPPGPVSGQSLVWASTGDITVRWSNPTNTNFARARVRYRQAGGGGGILYEETTGGTVSTLPLGIQRQITGFPRTGYQVEIVALSAAGIESTAVILNATWARLSTPTVTTDFASADLLLTAAAQAGALSYTWTVIPSPASGGVLQTFDGQPRSFRFPFEENQSRFTTPRPVLAWTCAPVDALGLGPTTAASGTATNAAPAPTTLNVFGAVDMVQLTITPSGAADVRDYRIRVYKGGVLQTSETFFTQELKPLYQAAAGGGVYTFDVTVFDRFGQSSAASAQTVGVDLSDRAEYLAELREETIYRDSISTDPAALKQRMIDNINSPTITYNNSQWNWTEQSRPRSFRHRHSILSSTANTRYYVATAGKDGVWTYWAGPLNADGQLVQKASQADAQANPLVLSAGGVLTRLALASIVNDVRCVRLYHTHATNPSYFLGEWFPRDLLTADDLMVETLSAISGNIGEIIAGTITGVVITGSTFQTSPPGSGERVVIDSTGLKTYDSTNTVQVEATTATNGELQAGAGAIVLDKSGIAARIASSGQDNRAYRFTTSAGATIGGLYAYDGGTSGRQLYTTVAGTVSGDRAELRGIAGTTATAQRSSAASLVARVATNPNDVSLDLFVDVNGRSASVDADSFTLQAVTGGSNNLNISRGYIDLTEIAAPSAPASDRGRLFLRDNGSGKTQLCIQFATGAVQVIATQP